MALKLARMTILDFNTGVNGNFGFNTNANGHAALTLVRMGILGFNTGVNWNFSFNTGANGHVA